MPEFRDIEGEVGTPYKAMGVFQEDFQCQNKGVVAWAWDPRDNVLACWRVRDVEGRKDVEFNFYHRDCVDPLGEFYREVEEGAGDLFTLPEDFGSFVRRVVEAYPDLENSQVDVEYIPEILGWNVVCKGKGLRNPEYFAPHFVETININLPSIS